MPSQFVVECRTNNIPSQNAYTVKDDEDNVILTRSGLTANTIYRDTLDLAYGCYIFRLTDTGEDGLSFWANTSQGTGYIRFKSAVGPSILKSFNADFGGEVYMQFTVGLTSGIDKYTFVKQPELKIYPNPADAIVYIDFDLPASQSGMIEITDMFGKKIRSFTIDDKVADSFTVDVSGYNAGVYFVTLRTQKYAVTKKMMCGY